MLPFEGELSDECDREGEMRVKGTELGGVC